MIWTPHATVATVVERNGLYLLVEETIQGRTMLNQPAGHIEEGETIAAAALRETLEETGWNVELTALSGIYTYPSPQGITFYRFAFAANPLGPVEDAQLDDGIIGPVWLSPEQVEQRRSEWRSPMVGQCIADHAAGRRYPMDLIREIPGQ